MFKAVKKFGYKLMGDSRTSTCYPIVEMYINDHSSLKILEGSKKTYLLL